MQPQKNQRDFRHAGFTGNFIYFLMGLRLNPEDFFSPYLTLADEATSALDVENEHEILAAIDELTRNKTVIMIAHRIQTVQKADHIIAIENGRIVQEGPHEQLVKEPGLYANFIAARQKASGWKL